MATLKAKRNRRPLSVRNQCQPPLAVVTLGDFGEGEVAIDMSRAMFLREPFELTAVKVGGGEFVGTVSALAGDGTQMLVVFDPVLAAGDYSIDIPPWMPDLRDSQGGYVAPATVYFEIT